MENSNRENNSLTCKTQSNEELMYLYSNNNVSAFNELYRRFFNKIYAYFLIRIKKENTAKELTQELFFKIHKNKDVFDITYRLEPWMYKIAKNLLLNYYRRDKSKVTFELAYDVSDKVDFEYKLVLSDEVKHLVNKLTGPKRDALIMRYLKGYSYNEISKVINKKEITTRKVVHRAIIKLRELA